MGPEEMQKAFPKLVAQRKNSGAGLSALAKRGAWAQARTAAQSAQGEEQRGSARPRDHPANAHGAGKSAELAAPQGYSGYIMETVVGVRELENRLSFYLRCVREGHDVVITDRGRPVAVLRAVSEDRTDRSEEEHLAALAAQGILKLGKGVHVRPPRGRPGPRLSEAVLRDRDERGWSTWTRASS